MGERHYRNISEYNSQDLCFYCTEWWNYCNTHTHSVYEKILFSKVKHLCITISVQNTAASSMICPVWWRNISHNVLNIPTPSQWEGDWKHLSALGTILPWCMVSIPHHRNGNNCAVSQMLRVSWVTSHENNYLTGPWEKAMRFPDTGNEKSEGEVELERVLKPFQTATSL